MGTTIRTRHPLAVTNFGSGAAQVYGQATLSTATLGAGSHSITAYYGGDSTHDGTTSSTLTQTVNQGTTTTVLGTSGSPSVFGQSVTFTATVSGGAASGTVTFKDGGTRHRHRHPVRERRHVHDRVALARRSQHHRGLPRR